MNYFLEIRYGKAFLYNQSNAQIQRRCTTHGNVIDGAVNGQFADAAAREKKGIHRVGIG